MINHIFARNDLDKFRIQHELLALIHEPNMFHDSMLNVFLELLDSFDKNHFVGTLDGSAKKKCQEKFYLIQSLF